MWDAAPGSERELLPEEASALMRAYCRMKLHCSPWFGAVVRALYPLRGIVPDARVRNILAFETINRANR